ncbi:dephospho-CoA kinase [Ideonella sp.]|uniref:dephospho-CoA kinase n=1 Tax=Ideonella sp. TaxID=1929293 RepID=UPI003BB6339C
MTRRIGLTGGIGSGKSTVAALLADRGCWIVDTDAISRALTAPGGAALPAIATAFGTHMLASNGALDRIKMRALAFSDPGAKLRLEAILHPLIGEATAAQAALTPPGQAVVFDVPLLTESKAWRDRVDAILVVDCSEATQMARVQQRSGWTEAEVRRVLDAQASRSTRRAIADAIIHNDGISLAALTSAVDQLAAAGFLSARPVVAM